MTKLTIAFLVPLIASSLSMANQIVSRKTIVGPGDPCIAGIPENSYRIAAAEARSQMEESLWRSWQYTDMSEPDFRQYVELNIRAETHMLLGASRPSDFILCPSLQTGLLIRYFEHEPLEIGFDPKWRAGRHFSGNRENFGGAKLLSNEIEWRGTLDRGTFQPYALIIHQEVYNWIPGIPPKKETTPMLHVVRVDPTKQKVCEVGTVDASGPIDRAFKVARELADERRIVFCH